MSANTIWYVQVGALVTGHVTGLTLSHDRALTMYGDRPRLEIAAVDAPGYGRLHLPGPVPALAGQRLMLLTLAHVGHWYFWPLYGLPVFIVLWSVIATTLRERRSSREEDER